MTIEITGLRRRYGNDAALDDVSLTIANGEFMALLGPSGSGKTTLLRILAGLEFPDAGQVLRDGKNLLALDARHRDVGMVFQHYALFRHMRVAENVAFGLRVRRRARRPPPAEIAARVARLLERVELTGYGDRYPAQLSGGQRQRVALARALAIEPTLLLLDEPFGALDAKVRVSLRRWLRHLHEDLALTTVFVTHDQEEALELADRIAVMSNGRIEQVGTPEEIYQAPATPFVFEFIGKVNRIPARVVGGRLEAGGRVFEQGADAVASGDAFMYVRPEHLRLSTGGDDGGEAGWRAVLRHVYLAGSIAHLELEVPSLAMTLEAEGAAEGVRERGLVAGAEVAVRPRQFRVFARDHRHATAGNGCLRTHSRWAGERAEEGRPDLSMHEFRLSPRPDS